ERNAFDQRWLEYELIDSFGIKLVRRTLAELHAGAQLDKDRRLFIVTLTGRTEVAVVYYRAGYGPGDYPTETEWEARAMLDRSWAVQCPTVAQQLAALRRTMELYSSTTRFALACNTSNKVIEPIQSRCAILRFARLSDTQVLSRVRTVAQRESVPMTPAGLEAVVFCADGDLRLAINHLQAAASAASGMVDAEQVFKVCDVPHPAQVSAIVQNCAMGHVDRALDAITALTKAGYASLDVVTTLFRVVKNAPTQAPAAATGGANAAAALVLPEYLKLEFAKLIGLAHMRILEGVSSNVQLAGLVARMARVVVPPEKFVV
ncbi:hypothetical protein AMAG_16578, partial [Allomyces macrogynus ATCC 38327]